MWSSSANLCHTYLCSCCFLSSGLLFLGCWIVLVFLLASFAVVADFTAKRSRHGWSWGVLRRFRWDELWDEYWEENKKKWEKWGVDWNKGERIIRIGRNEKWGWAGRIGTHIFKRISDETVILSMAGCIFLARWSWLAGMGGLSKIGGNETQAFPTAKFWGGTYFFAFK